MPSAELEARIRAIHPGLVKASDELNDTARSYTIPGYRGSLGFISSMSDHFCSSCNRLRLTADGQVKVSPQICDYSNSSHGKFDDDIPRYACSIQKKSPCVTRCGAAPTTLYYSVLSDTPFTERRRSMPVWKTSMLSQIDR